MPRETQTLKRERWIQFPRGWASCPQVKFPPKVLVIEPPYINFIGFKDGQSFVPKGHIGKFSRI